MKTSSLENSDASIDEAVSHLAAEVKLETGKDHATQAVRDIKEAALLKVHEVKVSTVQKADDVLRKVESKVNEARSAAERRTRENPLGGLLCAFGTGFVLGLIIRR